MISEFELEQYQLQLQNQLNGLSNEIKPGDFDRVQQSISDANTISQLDAISLGLNFHQFRIDSRENNQ